MKFYLYLLVLLQLVILLPVHSFALRLYTQDEYQAARDKAVRTAREGNHESALLSLERLLELEPDNHGARNDYITILIWDEQYKKALTFAPLLDLYEIPEYVLRSLIIAADRAKQLAVSDKLVKSYFTRFPIIPENTPAHIEGKTAYEIARLTFHSAMRQTSLSILKTLHEADPDNQRVLAGYVAVLSREQQHKKALNLLPQLDLQVAPEFVFDTLIESAEQLKNDDVESKLLALYHHRFSVPSEPPKTAVSVTVEKKTVKKNELKRQAVPRKKQPAPIFPHAKPISQAQKYFQAEEYAKAEEIILPLYLKGVKARELLIAVSRLFDVQKKYMEAAHVYQQLLELEPGNDKWKRGVVLNLFYAGAPFRALELLQIDPSLFSTAETNKITTDTNAILLRWSQYAQPPGTNRTEALDTLLIKTDRSITRLQEQDDSYNLSRLQMDYIVMLREKAQTQEVIEKYNELLAQEKNLPDYVLRNVASAYLDQQQPGQARDIYQQLLQRDPHSFELKKALFYAYFDNGEFQKGLQLVAEMEANTPLWRKDHSGGIVKDNNEKLQVSILAANALAYTDDLAAAQERYEEMLAAAPYNTELHDNLAMVYLWRGWPQKANEEIAIGKTAEPDNLYLAISQARTLIALYRFQEAEEQLTWLSKQEPQNKHILELQEDYQMRNKRQFLIWVDGGNSDGDGSDQGSSDLSVESYLYDKYYRYSFRPFIHQYYTKAKFMEGTGRYERLGIGTEYKRNRNSFAVELNSSYSGNSEAGVSLRTEHDLTDQLHFSLGYDSFSTNIPVRAYFHDITGSGYKIGGVYRQHESTVFTATYEYLNFSDTNERNSLSVSMQQRIMNFPRFKMILTPSFYQSKNSRTGTPYFNPEEDRSLNLSIKNEWLTYQRYDTSFRQILEISFGEYYQQNFGTDWTDALIYQHQWIIDKTLNFTYGFKIGHNYYDGEKEKRLAGFASLGWIF